jgi:hypothetical protein
VRALAHLDDASGIDFVLVEAWLFSRLTAAPKTVEDHVDASEPPAR